jgi:hypothetical protein
MQIAKTVALDAPYKIKKITKIALLVKKLQVFEEHYICQSTIAKIWLQLPLLCCSIANHSRSYSVEK